MVFVDFSPGWNPTRTLQKRTVACWSCQNMFLLDILIISLISRLWKGGSLLPVNLWKSFTLWCGTCGILGTEGITGHWSVRSFRSRKMKKREPVKKTGLFRPFLLLLSTVSSDFHLDDPALLWGVISLRDGQLLRRPDIWTLAIPAAPLLPSPTALPVCFCDTAPLRGIFSQGRLETPGTQSSFPAFQPSPRQRAWRPPHAHPYFKPSPQRALGSVVLIWVDVLDHLTLLPTILFLQPLWLCLYSQHCTVSNNVPLAEGFPTDCWCRAKLCASILNDKKF